MFSGNEPFRLHIKFAKYILGVSKKSTNFAVLSELRSFPHYIDIIRSMLTCWYRLQHLDKYFLLFNALETCKEYDTSKTLWITPVHSLCSLFKLKPSLIQKRFSYLKTETAVFIKNKCLNDWHRWRINHGSGKFDTYIKFKTVFGLENYLSYITFKARRSMIRSRISSHRLRIEAGRYRREERRDRLCTNCHNGWIED